MLKVKDLKTDIHVYIPFAKKDVKERMVYGYASTETLDSQGEIVKLDAIKAALPDYMKFANIREMHQPSAVGKTKEATIDEKGLYIGVKVVDDNAWKKVEEEVYSGFSIGGSVTEKIDNEIQSVKLKEISLVDRPANPDAVFDVVKNEDGIENEDKPEDEDKEEDQSPADDAGDDSTDAADEPKSEAVDAGDDKGEGEDEPADEAKPAEAVEPVAEPEEKEVADAGTDLAKNVYTADKIIYMAACLADLINFWSIDGKNVEKLTDALSALKEAAVIELNEKDEFYVPNEVLSDEMYEVVEAADKLLDLHKDDVAAALTAKKEAALAKELTMPTDDEVVAALTKQGMPVTEGNIALVKLTHADNILARLKEHQEASMEKDIANTNLEKQLIDLITQLTASIQSAPQLDPFVHYEINKADTQEVKPEIEPQPATQTQEVKPEAAPVAPETAPEPEAKPAAEGKPIKKTDEPEEFVKMAKADLTKLEDRLAKAEEAIAKVAALEERLAKFENSEVPTTLRGSVPVERFGKSDEVETDEKSLLEKIDTLSEKLKADPQNASLRADAEVLTKQYNELKRTKLTN